MHSYDASCITSLSLSFSFYSFSLSLYTVKCNWRICSTIIFTVCEYFGEREREMGVYLIFFKWINYRFLDFRITCEHSSSVTFRGNWSVKTKLFKIPSWPFYFLQRTKAIVDQRKLREIELHDARLAEIIQEQEKLKSRRVRGRRERAADERQTSKDSQVNFKTSILL